MPAHCFHSAKIRFVVILHFCLLCAMSSLTRVPAQDGGESTLGEGYVLIAPIGDSGAHLVNAKREIVHTWDCKGGAGNATYLLPDGSLLRTGKAQSNVFNARGGSGGVIKKISWDGEITWEYKVSDDQYHSHHDVEPLPNGNILVIAWEYHSKEDSINAGRDPKTISGDSIWPETILEIKPKGKSAAEIVWKWRLWDHLVQQHDKTKANYGNVADHPELVDFNYGIRRGGGDWIHMNAVDYNAELDQIALSARWFDEVWIIDHGTTTEEAASHEGGRYGKGGDLLYRWGNPEAYFAGFSTDRKFFAQHDVRWIEKGCPGEGHLMLFNNGDRRVGREYSSVDEFQPPLQKDGSYKLSDIDPFGPATFAWSYSDPENFVSDRISGAQRLKSGNTLICSGSQGWVFEVTPKGERVWEFDLSMLPSTPRGEAGLFRAPYCAADFPGLARLKK